ncbi:MAG: hypothetical protein LBB78_05895 [Spirochaetaceae bacterium]|jgi:hypothetical protein|nr:hypothetical protein [Spirochaetaceae bacterium]
MDLVAEESMGMTVLWVFSIPCLRYAALGCIKSICYNFFFRQFKAALFPGRIPVSSVDHPLDKKIPFVPSWVGIYLDFVAFWVRILGFLRSHYRRRGIKPALDFIETMGRLYAFAAETYKKNLSTTKRPRYLARPRFLLIHAADPHLMCIPSLHVMVVISAYTQFRSILRSLGNEEQFAPQIEEIHRGALNITEAILYVKQHSVNCIAAAMYAMTCFDPALFPQTEGADFVARLFKGAKNPGPGDAGIIRSHILDLYVKLLEAGNSAETWEKPLIDFLRSQPQRGA